MNKSEFLNILRQTLYKEVSSEALEQNIRFYDQYIGNRSEDEERKVIEELGDPRLIAKTIIDTEKVAKQKDKFRNNQDYQNNYYHEEEDMNGDDQYNSPYGKHIFFKNLTWYQKISIGFVIVLILALLVILGRVIAVILFTFGLPLLLIYLLIMLFRKR